MREETICLSDLPKITKQRVWKALQQDKPYLAELLAGKGYQSLLSRFDALVVIAVADLPDSAVQTLRGAAQ